MRSAVAVLLILAIHKMDRFSGRGHGIVGLHHVQNVYGIKPV